MILLRFVRVAFCKTKEKENKRTDLKFESRKNRKRRDVGWMMEVCGGLEVGHERHKKCKSEVTKQRTYAGEGISHHRELSTKKCATGMLPQAALQTACDENNTDRRTGIRSINASLSVDARTHADGDANTGCTLRILRSSSAPCPHFLPSPSKTSRNSAVQLKNNKRGLLA